MKKINKTKIEKHFYVNRLTGKEIKKMPRKNLSVDEFLALAKNIEPKVRFSRKQIYSLENGAFLGVHRDKKGKWYRLHLKKIWIKYYQLPYRTTKTANGKARIGKEMLISNMPLPRGPVLRK